MGFLQLVLQVAFALVDRLQLLHQFLPLLCEAGVALVGLLDFDLADYLVFELLDLHPQLLHFVLESVSILGGSIVVIFESAELGLEGAVVGDELLVLFQLFSELLDLCPTAINHVVLLNYVALHLVKLILVRLDEVFHNRLGALGVLGNGTCLLQVRVGIP